MSVCPRSGWVRVGGRVFLGWEWFGFKWLSDVSFYIDKANLVLLLSKAYEVVGSAALKRASGELEQDMNVEDVKIVWTKKQR